MKMLIIQTMDSLSESINNQTMDLENLLPIVIAVSFLFFLLTIFLRYYSNSKIDYYEISYSKSNEYEAILVKAKDYKLEEISKGEGSIVGFGDSFISGSSSSYITVYKIETLDNKKLIIPEEKIFDVQIIYKENPSEKRNKAPHIL